eukprot:CAMPEP_0198272726 /NCGR_PEP_ID=MMETSP1447-20131203/54311_1 /TAXON_ID=420782 /ORGANISM="Chaetoceros dichaeta, Strain CCMP1751" /LENGTH=405 /DNA_ID=CAMNT_0043966079 /DNA_START=36 /DNA_END=1253 /DNA_ORIENTATION=+
MAHNNNTTYSTVSQLMKRLGGVYRDPNRVSRDATGLLTSSVGNNLRPKISNLVENNGVSSNAMLLTGTIPMIYMGGKYNIPIEVYLPPKYPLQPPVAYVRPVPSMMIKEGHQHVGSDGMVYMPYLHNWHSNSHNLSALCTHMSNYFGTDPPLFARPVGQPLSNSYVRPSATHQPPRYEDVQQDQARIDALNEEMRAANIAADVARQAERAEQEAARQKITAEREQLSLINQAKAQLRNKVEYELRNFDDTCRRDIELRLKEQLMLEKSANYIVGVSGDSKSGQMEYLSSKKIELENHHEQIDELTEKLNGFITTVKEHTASSEEIKVDDLVLPIDILSGQMLALSAENAAISDTLFFLDKGLAKGIIALNVHLKAVRRLAKRQFLVKAHLLKVAASKEKMSYRGF